MIKEMAEKVKLSAKEKILLHLLDYPEEKLFPREIGVQSERVLRRMPLEVSQEGIGESIGINWKHVSRAVKNLKDADLIKEGLAHVEGITRRRKIYYLSEKGVDKARGLESRLKNETFEIKDFDGRLRSMSLAEILSHLGMKASILDVLKPVLDGITDLEKIEESVKRAKELRIARKSRMIEFIKEVPVLKHFYGRKEEIKELRDWLNSESKIMVITGVAGIGKTYLASRFVQDYIGQKKVYWQEIHDWDTIRNVLNPLSEFLSRLQRQTLRAYINSNPVIDLDSILEILKRDLEESNSIIVFDDIHKADKNVERVFSVLLSALKRSKGVKAIFISRHIPTFYDERDVAVRKVVKEIHLEGLDEESTKEFLRYRKIEERIFDKIYQLTKGHPLFLELFASVDDLEKPSRIRRFFYTEIFSKLSRDERRMLMSASVYRYPVHPSAILFDEDEYDTLERLVEKSLILEIPYKGYYVHDVVRQFVLARLTPRQRIKYHKEAARYYMEDGSDVSLLEAQHHLIQSLNYDQAARIAFEKGKELINRGYAEQFKNVLNQLREENLSPEAWVGILVRKGDAYFSTGEWNEALKCYSLSIDLNRDENVLLATAYRTIGHIRREQGKWKRALERYNRSIKISERLRDYYGIADTYRGIGKIYWRRGEQDKAIENYNKCIKYAKKSKDDSILAEVYIDLGVAYHHKGEFKGAIEFYKKGLELTEITENRYLKGRAYNNLGVIYYEIENWDQALEYWEECIKISKETGDSRNQAYALFNSADIYARKGDAKKSLEYLEKAMMISKRMKDNIAISYVYATYGIVYSFLKDWDKAEKHFRKSIRIIKDLEMPYNLAERYYEFGLMFRDKGDLRQAKAYLRKALEIYEKHGKGSLMEKVREEIEGLSLQ